MLIQAANFEKALLHVKIAALVLISLGWSINWTKSNFISQQVVIHLGFELSLIVSVTCPESKVLDLQETLRVRPATHLAAFYYRPVQRHLLSVKSQWSDEERFPD